MWLARVVYLLVGVAEGWGGRRGHACPCAVLGHAMLRHGVGVGVGVMRIIGRRFIVLLAWRVFTKMKGACEFHLGSAAVAASGVGGAFVVLWGLDVDCCRL